MLRGRSSECGRLDELVAVLRSGRSATLVLRGDPGVGKTALLDYLSGQASGCRVVRVGGVESEMELAFAGLQQLCAPMLDRLEHLPDPQRDALGVAFGLWQGGPTDRFLVGLAVLSLLSEVAEERPLVCLIDDVQWLDRASVQALTFVGRRLMAEPVGLVFAVRGANDEPELIGLPALVIGGLDDADARLVLASAIRGRLDDQVLDRIVAETRGNPLALLELPRGLTQGELAGGFGLPGAVSPARRIEDSFRRRLAPLPPETRRLLLVAAAEPVGQPGLVWQAAERLGVGADAATPAIAAGLVEFGARVRFRHPLVRSAVYRAASPADRHATHRALAEATDPELDPDRRAWHLAQATAGPDEDVAVELERSADRAQARGGLAAAAAFLERAATLTEPARRGGRALAAAQVKQQAGEFEAAASLLATAQEGPLDELQRARVDLLRAEIAFAQNRGSDAPPLLLQAAKQLEPLDVSLARETYLDALSAAQFAGRLASGGGVLEAVKAARAAPPSSQPRRAADLLLDGLALMATDGDPVRSPTLKQALNAFRRRDISTEEEIRWLWLASTTAADLWDDETWNVLATRHVQLARDAGALTVLPLALSSRVYVHLFAGELVAAASLVEELEEVTKVTGTHLAPYGALGVAAFRGHETMARELIEATITEVLTRGEGIGLTVTHWASAVLSNSVGRYEDALPAAEQASEHPEEMAASSWGLIELIEAATRSGKAERAVGALERLTATTRAGGSDWGLGMEARSRALLSEGKAAEDLYREAIDRLGRTCMVIDLARAHLIYGEWLRRENRRLDARGQVRTAHDMFSRSGAEAFADRARRELLATGETVRRRTFETVAELTAQEAQIARLARDGETNPEIGARLFISPRTVEWHLGNVFTKLDITSRRALRHALPDPSGVALRA
jgi:DNA-binding CsgD family transcriptional regulator